MDVSQLGFLVSASQRLGLCSQLRPAQTSFVFPEVACLEVGLPACTLGDDRHCSSKMGFEGLLPFPVFED